MKEPSDTPKQQPAGSLQKPYMRNIQKVSKTSPGPQPKEINQIKSERKQAKKSPNLNLVMKGIVILMNMVSFLLPLSLAIGIWVSTGLLLLLKGLYMKSNQNNFKSLMKHMSKLCLYKCSNLCCGYGIMWP